MDADRGPSGRKEALLRNVPRALMERAESYRRRRAIDASAISAIPDCRLPQRRVGEYTRKMHSPFEIASAVEKKGEGLYSISIPSGWEQGRGAFGGVVLAALARAILDAEPDSERLLRMLSGEICAPVLAEPSEIRVELLRRGKNMTFADARLIQAGAIVARASAGLSQERSTAGESVWPEAPAMTPLEQAKPVVMPPNIAPAFSRHYDFRLTGPYPFTGQDRAIVEGYTRELEPPARRDAPSIIALLDSYWPALFSALKMPRPIATAGFTAQLLIDPAELDPSEHLYYRAHAPVIHAGFFIEMRELWSGERVVAMNQQTFAILA